MRSKVIVGLVCASSVGVMLLLVKMYQEARWLISREMSSVLKFGNIAWVLDMLLNLLGYSIILLPGYIIYKYLQVTNYFDRITSPTPVSRALFACFGEPGERLPTDAGKSRPQSEAARGAELTLCFSGLMGAYLVWGLLQEKIMTQRYTMSDGTAAVKFTDSQFLVFINRLSALCVAAARLLCVGAPLSSAPLYKYSYCSLSNVMSAWFQYEALKFVSFPTQVLSKSCKVLPVMLMGRLVSGNKYLTHEYVTAALISLGMVMFLGTSENFSTSTVMTVSGLVMLALYMLCDSFTSSWQNQLFKQYQVSPLQMMCGVNLCSCLLTGVTLVKHETYTSLQFLHHPLFLSDCVLLSCCSALGQLLIYRTISKFGAVVFTIIMTLRQAVSILLSCLVYGHAVSWSGALGVTLVFAAVLLRVYCRQRLATVKRLSI